MKKFVYMKKTAAKTIQPGTYGAKITAVEEVAGYERYKDLIICFDVYDGTEVIKHWECLQFDDSSERIKKLRKMVKGLDGLPYTFLIGIEVTLTFEKEHVTTRQYCDRIRRKWTTGKKKVFRCSQQNVFGNSRKSKNKSLLRRNDS